MMRKRTLRRWLAGACALAAALGCFAATACGRGGSGAAADDDPTKDNLTVWVQNTQYQFFKEMETRFETENPGINIKIYAQPESNLGMSLDATLGGNTRVDVVATYGGMVASTLVGSKRLLDIDNIIKPMEANLVDAAISNKKDGNGKYFTAPLHGFASPVIYYNKNLFEEMKASGKLSQPQKDAVKEPATYAELKSLCDTIRAYGKETLDGAFSTWHLPHFMQGIHSRTMSAADYAKLCDQDADPNPFDNDSYQEGFKLLKRYAADGILAADITAHSVDNANNSFYSSKAAMRMGVSLDYATLNDNVTFDIGAFYLPVEASNPDVPLATGVYSDVVAVSAKSKFSEQSKKFVEFIMRADSQAVLADSALFPARSDADITGKLGATLEKIYNEMKLGCNDFYQTWSYPGVDIELLDASVSVLKGDNITSTSLAARKKMADFFKLAKEYK